MELQSHMSSHSSSDAFPALALSMQVQTQSEISVLFIRSGFYVQPTKSSKFSASSERNIKGSALDKLFWNADNNTMYDCVFGKDFL